MDKLLCFLVIISCLCTVSSASALKRQKTGETSTLTPKPIKMPDKDGFEEILQAMLEGDIKENGVPVAQYVTQRGIQISQNGWYFINKYMTPAQGNGMNISCQIPGMRTTRAARIKISDAVNAIRNNTISDHEILNYFLYKTSTETGFAYRGDLFRGTYENIFKNYWNGIKSTEGKYATILGQWREEKKALFVIDTVQKIQLYSTRGITQVKRHGKTLLKPAIVIYLQIQNSFLVAH